MSFYDKLKNCGISADELKNACIMITGANGMIGTALTQNLMELNDELNIDLKLLLMVRDENKLDKSLEKYVKSGNIKIIIGDVTDWRGIGEKADFIIHAASITVSKAMVEKPVEVIMTNVNGTKNILDHAKNIGARSVVYLSSMEAYGFTENEVLLDEKDMQYLNPLALRSSYPESKRMAENLCVAYFSEYGVPIKIIRLAQTFGKGVKENDTRVFAEFARCAKDGNDIVLLTDGASKRMYLDTSDAAAAIITVMLKGENGSAYNAANKETYCSIAEMAQMVADKIADNKIKVSFKPNGSNSHFSPPHKFFLDTSRIEGLGWKPEKDLIEMYREMMNKWK